MTKADALIELREKVAAGDCDYDSAWRYFVSRDMSGAQWATRFREAFCGSLDAAKALHEAVLPGWKWRKANWPHKPNLIEVVAPDLSSCLLDGSAGFATGEGNNSEPARAWLLAILDALIEQEKSNG